MLPYEELESIARLKRLSLINAEKDYLQNLVLLSIYSNIGRELVFKGGTCLHKVYKLDRFSEDLDFTLSGKIDAEKIADKIISDLKLLNIKGKIKEIKEYRNEINIRLLLNGPLYKGGKETQCFIPLNISIKEKVLLEPRRVQIISMYREIPAFEVFAMNEKEIFAEKIRAIMTRIKPRDIYDLWFLSKQGINFDINLADKKLALYNLKFEKKEFISRIEKMRNLWNTDLKSLTAIEVDFEKAKKDILERL